MKNLLKKIENKIMASGIAKFLAIDVVCLFDLEIGALVYIFKDELMLDDDLKELVLKRQFLKTR